jgi:hypothetical protein
MLQTASSLPSYRAFDTGLRHRTFPSDTASPLPDLLATTRTGLTPASDDELANTKISYPKLIASLLSRWTHSSPIQFGVYF